LTGDAWIAGFLRRHPDLAWRSPQQLGYQRLAIQASHIQDWFGELQLFLATEVADADSLVMDPSRTFNMDESGFPLSVKSFKALAPQGSRNVYNATTETRANISVLACCNAAGLFLPPLIIFKGERKRNCGMQDFPNAFYASSQSGWTDKDIFLAFLECLKGSIEREHITLPVLLFMDGHTSHLSFDAASFAKTNGIILYCLPAHASHILQPLDVGVFSALKKRWRHSVNEWHRSHPGEVFTKREFPGTLKSIWYSTCTADIAKAGFRKTGLHPLNPKAYDATRIVKIPQQTPTSPTCLSTAATPTAPPHSPPPTLSPPPHHPPTLSPPPLLPPPLLPPPPPHTSDWASPTSAAVPAHAASPVMSFDNAAVFQILPHRPLPVTSLDDAAVVRIPCPLPVIDDRADGAVVTILPPHPPHPNHPPHSPLPAISGVISSSFSAMPAPAAPALPAPSFNVSAAVSTPPDSSFHASSPTALLPTPSTVSPAFSILTVPTVKRINKRKRQELPKATTGARAMEILANKEHKKKREEIEKMMRKAAREEKKTQKEEEKEKKGGVEG
jgi:hypothetical protein